MSFNKVNFQTKIPLNDGNQIPVLGFGVYEVDKGSVCEQAVCNALEAGYRLIDTAAAYGNEQSVGQAIAKSGIARNELFITTKTSFDLSEKCVHEVFEQSLEKLGVDYVDLYLIHWPTDDDKLVGTWEILEKFKQEGRCRSIGVSNFTVQRFEKAFLGKVSSIPVINQIELHAFNQQKQVVEFCRKHDILVQSYSPLARASNMTHPALCEIAQEYGKTVAQVMLRWLIQKGIPAIPKSKTKKRIVENTDLFDFELNDNQIKIIDGLDKNRFVQQWRPEGFY